MKVTIRDSHHGVQEFDLERMGKDSLAFGRMPECDIVLHSAFVSRPHGIIYRENGNWYIQDMKSTYGTYYMDRPIEKMPITDGTVIRLYSENKDSNHCVEMRFTEPYIPPEPQYNPPQPPPYIPPEPDPDPYYPPDEPGMSPFALISLISGCLSIILFFICSKTGVWLPLLFALVAVAFAIVALVGGRSKGMSITGVCTGGLVFILSIWLLICSGCIGPFSWCVEGRKFPLSTPLAHVFDTADSIDNSFDSISDEEAAEIFTDKDALKLIEEIYFGEAANVVDEYVDDLDIDLDDLDDLF
ncbi:MAG: FHA domain-containing protein [Eubacterium sp.]|nr:FHA domain-containing protein [Eubacterium sp.]